MRNSSLHNALLLLLIGLAGITQAAPINMQTVREVAVKFVNANAKTPLQGTEDLQLVTTYKTESDIDAFHIFNTPNGFVIVSADDRATPILGYSDEGRPFGLDNIPMQLQGYLQGFVEQMEYCYANHLPADETIIHQWERVQTIGLLTEQNAATEVTPLLTDTWNQNCYYNELCPVDSSGPCGHTLVGCAATSFAQILHYWGYPATGTGSHTYTPKGYPQQTANFGNTTYDWANMPDSLSSSSTSTEINAVATLMWHCGVAVDMRYGPSFSGANPIDVATALVNYFDYSDELSIVFRDDYSDAEWLTLIKNCLDVGRPVHYSGFNMNGGGGHGFVCDGYNTNDLLHFNWGWGGYYNGYYSISAMNPGPYMLSYFNIAIIDIHPNINTFHFTTAGTWSEPSNWQGGALPGINDIVFIDVPCQLDQNAEVAALTVLEGQSLTLQSGKTLTVTGDLTNTVAAGMVVEDSAQLVHNTDNVQATVRKAISPIIGTSGGWHLIALPLTGSIDVASVTNLLNDEYDLYGNDESTSYWKNSKTSGSGFTELEATKGYLYANEAAVTLGFSGTLENSSNTVSVPLSYTDEADLSGFNLVGNPFPCNAYLDRDYYVMKSDGTGINPVAVSADTPIPPCTAVFVKAKTEGETVEFTRGPYTKTF